MPTTSSTFGKTFAPYTTEFQLMDHMPAIIVFSVVIAVFGTAANTLSLSYFRSVIRSGDRTRYSDTSTTELFIALNIYDLLVSISAAFYNPVLIIYDSYVMHVIAYVVCLISMLMTGFITCLLAVVRAIHLVSPLHVINWRTINISLAVYSTTVVLLTGFYLQQSLSLHLAVTFGMKFVVHIFFQILAGVFLTVVFTNVISFVKLYFSQSVLAIKRKATITVVIISVIYCVCNLGFIVIFGSYLFSLQTYKLIPHEIEHISIFILLPLNSACNPLVYLMRKEDMRTHVKKLCGKVVLCFCRKNRETSTD